MKLKRMISVTLALTLMVGTLTGCSSKAQDNLPNSSSDGKVQVEFWNTLTGTNAVSYTHLRAHETRR